MQTISILFFLFRYTLQLDQIDADEVDHPIPCDCILTKCIVLKTHLKRLEGGEAEIEVDEENGESDNEEVSPSE